MILGGGYWWTKSKISSVSESTMSETPNVEVPQTTFSQAEQVLVDLILNSNGFVAGNKKTCQFERVANCTHTYDYAYESISKDRLVFGDLDEDGQPEVATVLTGCGVSCGLGVVVFQLLEGKVVMSSAPETFVAGAAKNIDSLNIENGVLSVTVSDFDPARTNKFKIIRGDLKIYDQATGQFVSSSIKNANFSFISPMGGEKWKVGQTVKIKWMGRGILSSTEVIVYLKKGNRAVSVIGETLNSGEFDWKIPESLDIGHTPLTDTSDSIYKIGLDYRAGADGLFYSNNFSITR